MEVGPARGRKHKVAIAPVQASAASVGSKGGVGVRARVFLQEGVAAGSDAKVAASHGIEQVVPAQVETGEGDAVVESLVAGRSLLVAFGGGQVETVRQRVHGVEQAVDLAVGSEFQEGSSDLGVRGDGHGGQRLRRVRQDDTARQRPAAAVPKVGFPEGGGRSDLVSECPVSP